MTDPLPETTRVKGGGSARIGAVILAICLVAVIGIGIVGRQTPAPVAVAPPAASRTPSSRPTPSPRRLATPRPLPTPDAADAYGASLIIGNIRYVTIMSELSPGNLSAELHYPSPPRLPVGTLEFSELWKDGKVDAAVAIGSWQIDLEKLAGATTTPANVLEAAIQARPNLADEPLPVRSGYRITADGSNDLLFSSLMIQVVLGKHMDDRGAAPTLRFGVEARVGNVRRFVILEPDDQGSFKASFALPAPRRATTAQLLLQNVQLTVSHDARSELADFTFELTPDQARLGASELIVAQSGPTYRIVARTLGHGSGKSIEVTVIARRLSNGDLSR